MSSWDTYKKALKLTSPVSWLVAEGAEKAAKAISNASDQGIDQLKQEVAKQNLQMQFAQHQARVAQELAIAKRIENAEEVEIEEFYDTFGKGGVGLEVNPATESASFNAGAEGRKITKRVYHFKGWRQSEIDTITQELGEADK